MGSKGQLEGSEGLLEGSEGQLEGSEGLLEGSEGWLEGSEGWLEGPGGQPAGCEGQPAGSEGQPEGGQMDGRTDRQKFFPFHKTLYPSRMYGRTDGWTEFLPILQDFVPCRGRCPATFCDFTTSKRQGKGTADLMMPFGILS